MKNNVIKDKTYQFALKIVFLLKNYKFKGSLYFQSSY